MKCSPSLYAIMRSVHSKIMSPEEFAERMREFNSDVDTETRHEKMDELMASVLSSLGYEEGIKIFDNAKKWYA